MTSVASETSVLAYRTAKSDRAARPSGMRDDGAFATLMDHESRPEPQRSERPSGTSQARETEKPADRPDATRRDASPEARQAADASPEAQQAADASPESQQAAPDATAAAAVPAPDGPEFAETIEAVEAIVEDVPEATVAPVSPDSPIAPVVAQTTLPAPTPVPVVAAGPTQPAPTAQPVEAPSAEMPSSATPAAPVAAPVIAPKPATTDKAQPAPASLAGQPAPQQETAAPQIKAAERPAVETPATETTGETKSESTHGSTANATTANAGPAAETETETPRELKPVPAQSAKVRPDATPDKPGTEAADIAKPEDLTVSAKPALDPAAQSAPPAVPAHAAATQAATPQSAPVSAAQPVPVNAIAVEIASQARAGNSRFEIRLDPPELGRIDVRLDIDTDGNVKSRLVIERADTYDLLRRDQSTLERALQQAGLKTSDNGLEFSLRDQGFAQRRDDNDLPRGIRAAIQDAEVPPSEAASGYARLLGARGGIDIRV